MPSVQDPLTTACFDFDGVLIDTMPLHARAWQEAAKPLGLGVSRRAIYEWEGESGIVTARKLLSRRRLSQASAAALLRDKERRFQQLARRVRIKPALAALLGRLSRRGIRLGLVTGTSAGELRRVMPPALLARFHAVITGDEVRRGKPHPEPYLKALRRLRASPRRTIVIENAPYGIRSARRARVGVVIALASSLPPQFLREAHGVVRSVRELCAVVERLTMPQHSRYNSRAKDKET
ncbi:MAG: HAD family phosphatase [Candidatus Omnitrophica bacterium]|nr:HAD family phosphatase [Candidatus Omnitrophota bacterium]